MPLPWQSIERYVWRGSRLVYRYSAKDESGKLSIRYYSYNILLSQVQSLAISKEIQARSRRGRYNKREK